MTDARRETRVRCVQEAARISAVAYNEDRERGGLREANGNERRREEKVVDIFLDNEIVADTCTLNARVCKGR